VHGRRDQDIAGTRLSDPLLVRKRAIRTKKRRGR
jgi:hypothetical protein